MKQLKYNFKENKLLKLYFLIFSIINIIYLYFEVSKTQYVQGHLIEGTIEMHQYQYLARISKVTSFLEISIILIYLAYLIKVLMKKDILNIKQFLAMNFVFMIVLIIVNYLISVIFSAPVGNLTQQLLMPSEITYKISICLIAIKIYKEIRKSFRTAES